MIQAYVDLGMAMAMGMGIIAGTAFDEARDRRLRARDARHLFTANMTRLALRRGSLTLVGDLTMGTSGRMHFEIASGADFDTLVVTHALLLPGNPEMLNLGYTPVDGDSFSVLSFNQRLSNPTFSQRTWSGFESGVISTATCGANEATRYASTDEAKWCLHAEPLFCEAFMSRT